jgi:rhodanese-related sulfurtransferase
MEYDDIAPEDVADWLAAHPGAEILDVRTPPEFVHHRIEGARLVPVQHLAGALSSVDLGRPRLVVCEHGIRSVMACELLADAAHEGRHSAPLANLRGGMAAWIGAGGAWVSGAPETGTNATDDGSTRPAG